jgi:hypothetical protein
MRGFLRAMTILAAAMAPATTAIAQKSDSLALARLLYNQHRFQEAVTVAEQVRLTPSLADRADLIAARAYLERYRESSASDDLTNARERLRRLNPQLLDARERSEYLVGLGEALYFDEAYGAAANLFVSVLDGVERVAPDARERVLDWWATSTDRDGRPRPDAERQVAYDHIRDRMSEELLTHPASATASYWLAAAARGRGDLQSAWDAVQSGWLRASFAPDHGLSLRADLDQLMQRAIIPERARALSQPADALRLEWENFKDKWKQASTAELSRPGQP